MSPKTFYIAAMLVYAGCTYALDTDLKLDTDIALPTDIVVENAIESEEPATTPGIWNWDSYLCADTDELWLDMANLPEYGPIFSKLFNELPLLSEIHQIEQNRDNLAIAFMRVLDKPEAFNRFVTCDLDPLVITPQQYYDIYRTWVTESLAGGTLTNITPEQLVGMTGVVNGIK